MAGPRLQITPGMRAFLDYPKFAGPTRMLVLDANYFFDQSWLQAAARLGWETATVPSVITGNLTRDDVTKLFTTIGEFKPDFVIGSNYAGMDTQNMFARFFEDARIPHVSWFTDTPRMILFNREVYCSPYGVAATWERAYIPHFEALGFQHIHYMPLATDPALFDGEPAGEYTRPFSFVGTSMTQQANEAWEKLDHLPSVVAAIHDAFDQGRVTRETFAGGIGAILPADLLEPRNATELRNIELGIVYESTRRARTAMAVHMAPYGVEVRGDPDWAAIVPNAGGLVAYHTDLAGYYRTTAVNLNTTSLQMRWTVNQRVFDCPTAGGFLITDRQRDLEELFDPETEVVTYESLDELEEKSLHYLAHERERLEVVRRARARILAHHTHDCRLRTLEAYLRERFVG